MDSKQTRYIFHKLSFFNFLKHLWYSKILGKEVLYMGSVAKHIEIGGAIHKRGHVIEVIDKFDPFIVLGDSILEKLKKKYQ